MWLLFPIFILIANLMSFVAVDFARVIFTVNNSILSVLLCIVINSSTTFHADIQFGFSVYSRLYSVSHP